MAMSNKQLSKIPEFYNGRSVFVTGFTGFIGELLVEKLLWSCPGIVHIYILIRGSKKLNYKQRVDEIFNSRLFTRLRENKKEMLKKVIPLEGDLLQPGLGLSPEQRSELCQNVSIVFHCAASVRFDEPLPLALDINVKGSKSSVELALDMPKLVCYTHVSTAYSNSNREVIEEKIYPATPDWKLTLEIRDKIDEATFSILSNKYMSDMVNSYVFAKSLAEQVIAEYSDRLPSVICRPSIVTGALEEPIPGWVENLNGPVGIVAGVGTGVIRTALINESIMPDFMPADIVVRILIVSACARHDDREEKLQVYNCCSKELSVGFAEHNDLGLKAIRDMPFKFMLWAPRLTCTTNYYFFYLHIFLFQLLPAAFLDVLIRLAGKTPILWKAQKKIYIGMQALSHFTTNFFYFHNKRIFDLEARIRPDDFEEFHYVKRPTNENFYKYFLAFIRYQGTWLFKMTDEDHLKAKKLSSIMHAVDLVSRNVFMLYLVWKVYTLELIPTLLDSIYRFIVDF